MVEAFGVEQDTNISVSAPNPNNRPVTRPQGFNPNIINKLGDDLIESLTDAAEAEEEANIVRSIANARDKMRRMEAGGKTPVEISAFRDEASSEILKRFPTNAAVNMVQTGLRASRAQSVQVRADGTLLSLDENGNILSTITPSDPEEALNQELNTLSVNVETELPTYVPLGGQVLQKAIDNGYPVKNIAVNNLAATSLSIGVFNNNQTSLQQVLRVATPDQAEEFIKASRTNIMGGITGGLSSIMSPEIITALQHPESGITPGDVRALATSYVNDWITKMGAEEAFSLFRITPAEFQTQMNGAIESIDAVAQAAFSKDNTLLEREKTKAQYQLSILTDNTFIELAETKPELFRLATTADVMGKAANLVLLTQKMNELYHIAPPGMQRTILDISSWITSDTAASEALANTIGDKRLSTVEQIESFIDASNILMEQTTPNNLAAIKKSWNPKMNDQLAVADDLMAKEGRSEEWNLYKAEVQRYIKNLEEVEEELGTTVEDELSGLRGVRSQATKGSSKTFTDILLGLIEEGVTFEKREGDPDAAGVTKEQQTRAQESVRKNLDEAE